MTLGCGVLLVAAAWYFLPKPPLLDDVSFSRRIIDRNGNVLFITLSNDDKYRLFCPLSNIAPDAVTAMLQQEDRFYDFHPGINPFAVMRSIWRLAFNSHSRSGASTISMQVARLRFGLKTRSFTGKATQMFRALQLERHYSKTQILEAYLNLAPYGGNIEGIEAASVINFGKNAARLTLPEAAALSVIPQNPARRALRINSDNLFVTNAQNRLLQKLGASPETLAFRARRSAATPFLAPHFTRQILRESSRQISSGNTISTTLDLDLQRLLEHRISTYLTEKRAYHFTNAAALLVDTREMEILAQVGSANFSDATLCGQVDCTHSRRSPGSTLKPFVYALALEQGLIHPFSLLHDVPVSYGSYNPENFDRDFLGPVHAADALVRSRNIPAIELASQLKRPSFYEFLRSAGIPLPRSAELYGLTLPLGGAEITMQDLVRLYGVLANNGLQQPLRRLADSPRISPQRLLSPESTFLLREMMRAPRPGLGTADRAIFWKTGTSNGFHDAWTVAIFDHYILAVWVGNANGQSNPAFIGSTCAAPLLFRIIDAMLSSGLAGQPPNLPPPEANLRKVNFCAASGEIATPLCEHTTSGWFIPGVSPIKRCSVHRVVYIDSESGLRLPADDGNHRVRKEVYEFWPEKLLKLFRQAGVPRRLPPPYLPGSLIHGQTTLPGNAPRILSPKAGATYELKSDASESITLQAEAEPGVTALFWFAGKQFLGRCPPTQSLPWKPVPGNYQLTVIDDAGRTASREVKIGLRMK